MPLRRLAPLAVIAGLLLTPGSRGASPPDWTRIDHPTLHGGVYISYVNDVLPPDDGSGWLAGGYVVDPDGIRTPSVWSSRDGASWSRTTLPATPSSERRDGVFHIARRGGVTIALGDRFDRVVKPAAWRSSGGTWTALDDASGPLLTFAGKIVDVTTSQSGFLALGWAQSRAGTLVDVFASSDGRAWSLHSAVPVPVGERFLPSSVTAVGERLFVVGASFVGAAQEGRIFVWDGQAWSRIDPRASGMTGPGENQVAAIAYRPGVGFVAGGLAQRGDLELPAAWLSSDGVEWRRLPDDAVPSPAGDSAIHAIVVAGSRFVAAGNSRSGPLLWESTNGRQWKTVDAPKRPYVADWANAHVAATRTVTVLTLSGEGANDAYRRGPNGTWSVIDRPPAFPGASGGTAELRGVAASASRLVAVGEDARGHPLVLTSRNARSWTRAPLPDTRARLLAVAFGRGVFAIVGWRLIDGRAHVALWTSTSGTGWRRLGGTVRSPVGAFVDVEPQGSGFAVAAFEGSSRGPRVGIWWADRRLLRPGPVLGAGEARGICVGPHGATVVAVRGEGAKGQIVAWQRGRAGGWSREAELVAARAEATGCADAPAGTLIVGLGTTDSGAAAWRRPSLQAPWTRTTLAVTSPPSELLSVSRSGKGFLTTGRLGARGQVDLAVWRIDRNSLSSIGGSPVFAEAGYQAGLGIVQFGNRIVVVGSRGSGNGAIWVGPVPQPGQGPVGVG